MATSPFGTVFAELYADVAPDLSVNRPPLSTSDIKPQGLKRCQQGAGPLYRWALSNADHTACRAPRASPCSLVMKSRTSPERLLPYLGFLKPQCSLASPMDRGRSGEACSCFSGMCPLHQRRLASGQYLAMEKEREVDVCILMLK
ncbi:unnamed protein product [Tetraodon nigroviridis]|uniref:(spotted green pufferfish) hypothetical protein n=1 Tax=Tetraodon nigroviridis TaxID=99883 RepID=Q4SVC0_TETNG|nr:unnamed protein product [Tetraodon nigroviridis]